MYVLTIYRVEPCFEIEWQQVAETTEPLKAYAVTWAQEEWGFGQEEDTQQSLDEQYTDLVNWLDSAEADDPRIELRKANTPR